EAEDDQGAERGHRSVPQGRRPALTTLGPGPDRLRALGLGVGGGLGGRHGRSLCPVPRSLTNRAAAARPVGSIRQMERMELFGDADRGAAGVRKIALARLAGEIARSAAAIGRVAVEGEVVRPTRHPGGIYFTLKDRAAQVPVRCPAKVVHRCRAVAGERVQVTGSLTWLSDRGLLQLVAEEVVPVGAGAIAALLAE